MAAVVAVNPMNAASVGGEVDPLLSESDRIERYESGKVLDERLKAEFGRSTDSIAAFQELRDALSSSSASREYELERAWHHTCEALLKLQNELLQEGRLLSSVRLKLGPLQLGQTLLHLAVLWKLYQRPEYSVVHLLLRLEPPLLCATYEGHLYRDENLLHMAVAHGDGELVLELAAFSLQPRAGFAGPDVVGGAYLHGDSAVSAADESLESLKLGRPAASGTSGSSNLPWLDRADISERRNKAWKELHKYEKGRGLDKELDAAWCASWLRAAWVGMINREATGTFFMPPPRGECYYGGTPLAFAVVLGHASIVRTLTVDVGCLDETLWLTWRKQRAERRAGHAAAAGGRPLKPAPRSDAHLSEPLPLLLKPKLDDLGPCELLENWDPRLCARIDLHESHRGNTCAHMAIQTSEDSTMFFFLDDLYNAGYGRYNSLDLYEAHAETRSQLSTSDADAKSPKSARRPAAPSSPVALPPASSTTLKEGLEATISPSSFATLKRSLESTTRIEPPRVFSLVRRKVEGTMQSVKAPAPRKPRSDSAEARPLLSSRAGAAAQTPPPSPMRAGSGSERSSPSSSPAKAAMSDLAEERKKLAESAEDGAEDGTRPRLGSIINAQGLTAQTLAASLGNREQFVDLWRARSKFMWTWGGVTRREFPLDQVDDIGQCADDHPTIYAAFDTASKPEERKAALGKVQPSTAWRLVRQLLPVSISDAGSSVAAIQRQPTALEQIVLAGHWHMLADLEDEDEDEMSSSIRASNREAMRADERELRRAKADKKQLLEIKKLVDGMVQRISPEEKSARFRGEGTAAGVSHALAIARAKHDILSNREEKPEQLSYNSSLSLVNDEADENGEVSGGGRSVAHGGSDSLALLDGEEGEAEVADAKIARAGGTGSGTSLLRHLLQVKWDKIYRGLFLWRMFERLAFIALLWATLLVRTSQGVVGPSDGSGGAFPAEPLFACRSRLVAERRELVPADSSDDAQMAFREQSCAAAVVLVPLLAAFLAAALLLQIVEIEARARLLRSIPSRVAALCRPRGGGGGGGGANSNAEDPRDTAELYVELVRRGIKLPAETNRAALLKALCAAPEAAPAEAGFSSRAATLWAAGYASALGHFYLGTRLFFLVFSLAATIVDILGGWTASTSILYALGGFAGTLHVLYFLVGFSKTGPLVMMIYSNVLLEFVRWLFVFLPLILSFTIAFFALNTEHSWASIVNHDLLYAFQTATVAGQAEQVLNNNPFVEGSANARMWLAFFVVANFIVYLLLTTLLIALVSNIFNVQMKDPRSRWHLERARAALMIEASLSSYDRLSLPPEQCYAEWMHCYEWMSQTADTKSNLPKSSLPMRPYFAATENSLAAERETAGRREAGNVRGFMTASTRAFIDEK